MQKTQIQKVRTRETKWRQTVGWMISLVAATLLGSVSQVASTPLIGTAPLAAQTGADVARAYREAHEVEILHDFAELLSYPNRAFTEDIVRAAEYIRGQLEEVGIEAELLRMEGASPIVYGELIGTR